MLTLLGGCGSEALVEITGAEPAIGLPRDEAPHCYGGEWWYYSGRLSTEEGRGYGIQAVVFHDAHVPLFVLTEGWAAHFAVADETLGDFHYDQSRRFAPARFDCPERDGFDLHTSLVQMTGSRGIDELHAAMPDGRYTMDLVIEDERGIVLHGGGGSISYGPYGRSFYYSRPMMRASGELRIDGQAHEVTGYLWFDRQWGRNVQNPWLEWDWFSLRLDDGTYVMLYAFRHENRPVSLGTFIPADGEPRHLEGDDFVITPTAFWISRHTGATYPVGWNIDVPESELAVTVSAVAHDQEMDARPTTLNVYWEGLCTVTGTHAGEPVAGEAYVELTNYVR